MAMRIAGWFCLISVIFTGLLGFGWYLAFLSFIASFIFGILTILYFSYDKTKIFSVDLDCLDNPLQQTNFSIQIPSVPKYDNRITGSETVDSFLNEIITIIVNDYVTPWYEILTDDDEFTTHAIRRLVLAAGVNVSNRVKGVDWIYLLSTRFPEELTTHLKLFKQSRVRLKHMDLLSAKDLSNGSMRTSPKKQDEKKTHRRNKSETDLSWPAENLTGRTLKDIFFELECSVENRLICRDIFCIDPEREYELLCEVSEAVLYLIAPEEAWRCHALKMLLIELISSVCCRDSCLPSELFLIVVRSCGDAEELDATLELVQKDIQKLHSKDSAGEWELQDRQKLSSLHSTIPDKISEEVSRSLKFIRATAAWRSNAQYLLEIEMNEADAPHTSKAVLDNLRSSALELCDLYLAPNRPAVMGVPEHCHAELVRKVTTEGEEFSTNPVTCFDDVQKCVCDALECCRDSCLPSELFLIVVRSCGDAEELDATLELVQKDIQKLVSSSSTIPDKISEEVSRSLKFIRATAAWRSNAQYLLEIEMNEADAPHTSKAVLDNLRSSALELCDLYLAPNRPAVMGVPEHCHAELVRKVTTEGEEFSTNPVTCFDDVQKCVCDALEDDPSWQSDFMMDEDGADRSNKYPIRYPFLDRPDITDPDRTSLEICSNGWSTKVQIDAVLVNSLRAGMRTLKNMPDQFANTVDGDDDSVPLKLLEEVLGIRGLWLRRRLLAPLRTLIADRVNRHWLTNRGPNYGARDAATKARTRVAAKVALLSACSVFDLFQTQEINRRLIFVLLEVALTNLFPDNDIPGLFRKLYSNSPRVPAAKKSVNI
ncbi:putative sorting nexin 13 [Operophtera brumata]|uniref:Putative sorting nexin 13 n=1 Tax=Operophtera brumata TaxID=104452 RepID=A0A0L7LTB3_OPEBR|nr:putative sorting nexin 13 [Operophtera brumata]